MLEVPHNRLTHDASEERAAAAVARSGVWSAGAETLALERDLAQACGRPAAAAVASGLAALRLALVGLRIQPGDEVIVPAYSCVALPNAVLACGAKPVAADVAPQTWGLDPDAARKVRSSRSRAIIAVHTFGAPADIAGLRSTGLPVIEDCAHGLGVAGMGNKADIAVTSFYATKLVGAGEGGAVTGSEELTRIVRQWRDYADQPPAATRLNDKISEFAAAVARCQLAKLSEMLERRAALALRYIAALWPLEEKGGLRLPPASTARAWYRFAVELVDREAAGAIAELAAAGVRAAEPVMDWRPMRDGSCPVSNRAYRRVLSLPLYPTLREEEQRRVISAVLRLYEARS